MNAHYSFRLAKKQMYSGYRLGNGTRISLTIMELTNPISSRADHAVGHYYGPLDTYMSTICKFMAGKRNWYASHSHSCSCIDYSSQPRVYIHPKLIRCQAIVCTGMYPGRDCTAISYASVVNGLTRVMSSSRVCAMRPFKLAQSKWPRENAISICWFL